jgi:hypothetical protein
VFCYNPNEDYMEPITAAVGKKVTDSLFKYVRDLFTRDRDLRKEIASLKAELDSRSQENKVFERRLSELKCRHEDDSIYWSADGGAFCPLCISGPQKLFTPLTHGINKGSYYCCLHQHYFETEELRERRANHVPPARTWREQQRRLEAASRGRSRTGS